MVNDYSLALKIHQKVNTDTTYKSDWLKYGVPEHWVEASTLGDCEDYALLKRQRLIEAGFNRKDLHLACCWDETGGYHCVLLCRTDKGWFVLDNRYTGLMTPKSLPYRWDKALNEVDGKWYTLSF